jgi:uncharacterized protein (TIGR02118 family)
VFCLRRRSDVEAADFTRYWRDEHGPLVASHAAALGVLGYRQLHALPVEINRRAGAARGAPEPYDGVAELDFASYDDMRAAAATPDGQTAAASLLADERRFIDHARSPVFFTSPIRLVARQERK